MVDILPVNVSVFGCKGKFSYWKITTKTNKPSEWVLFVSFMLTGAFLDRNPTTINVHYGDLCRKLPATDHIKFIFSKNNFEELVLWYNDSRQFGKFELKELISYYKVNCLDSKLNELGPDILNTAVSEVDFNKFYQAASGKKMPIVNTLLDQKIIAGIGNYLRAEALYVAKIDPFTISNKLSQDDFKKLYYSIKNVAKIFYEKGKITNDPKLTLKASDLIDTGNAESKKNHLCRFTRTELINQYKDNRFLVYQQKQTTLGEKVLVKKLNNRSVYYVDAEEN